MRKQQETTKVKQLSELVATDLSLESGHELDMAVTEQELLSALIKIIAYLLDHDFNRLLNILYRIDVDENRVKELFASEESVAIGLSKAILERQIAKLQFRSSYRQES
jgi:hypothetical protein